MRPTSPKWLSNRHLQVLIGVILSALMAALLVSFFPNSTFRANIPLLFIAVMVLISLRYGAAAAFFGALASAAIFAYFLFTPIGSFQVMNEAARTNIGWMLLVGIPISYFLNPPARPSQP